MFGACVAVFVTVVTGHNQLMLIDACKVSRLITVPINRHEAKTSKCQVFVGNTSSFLADSCDMIQFRIKQELQKAQDDTRTASRPINPVQ